LADLVQSGIVGLLQAHERYGRPPDDGFAAYATPRIRGAMLDAVRAGDWSPRSLRRRERSIEAAKARIEKSTGERASAAAIAHAIGASLEDYFRSVWDISVTVPVSLDDPAPGGGRASTEPTDGSPGPAESLQTHELLRALAGQRVADLPDSYLDHQRSAGGDAGVGGGSAALRGAIGSRPQLPASPIPSASSTRSV
jgi:RNA polymerase sigma factor for flagellar operon FliA